MATNEAGKLSFTALPAEIRNEIYELFFDGAYSRLQFLRTCKRVYHEAGMLAFSVTVFSLKADAYTLRTRGINLSDRQKSRINRLTHTVGNNLTRSSLAFDFAYRVSILPEFIRLDKQGGSGWTLTEHPAFYFDGCMSKIVRRIVAPNIRLRVLLFRHEYMGFDSAHAKRNWENAPLHRPNLFQHLFQRSVAWHEKIESCQLYEESRSATGLLESVHFKIKTHHGKEVRRVMFKWKNSWE